MCARCEELEEEVAYLRSELGLQIEAGEIANIQRHFGLSDHKARVLVVLHKAKRRVVSQPQLADALPLRYGGVERSSNFINATIAQLRKIVSFDAIENVQGVGYRLSEAMNRQLDELVAAETDHSGGRRAERLVDAVNGARP